MIVPDRDKLGFVVPTYGPNISIAIPVVRNQTDQRDYNPGPVDLPGWHKPAIKPDKYAPLWYESPDPNDIPIEEPAEPDGYVPYEPEEWRNYPKTPCASDYCIRTQPCNPYAPCGPCGTGSPGVPGTPGGRGGSGRPGGSGKPGSPGTPGATVPIIATITPGTTIGMAALLLTAMVPFFVAKKKRKARGRRRA